jgi:hypothetical protein
MILVSRFKVQYGENKIRELESVRVNIFMADVILHRQ